MNCWPRNVPVHSEAVHVPVHEELDGYRVDFAAWAHTVCRSSIERGNQVREQESGDGDEYE